MDLNNFYTYAFLETPSFPLTLPQGLASQVMLIHGDELSAIVEPGILFESLRNNDEKIIQMAVSHDRVIRELYQQTTVLPLRFGTYFVSTEKLSIHLKSHYQEYRDKIKQIDGKTEFALKLIPRQPEELAPVEARGRNYFLAKKQQYQSYQNFSLDQAKEKANLIDLIKNINQLPVFIQDQEAEVKIYLLINSQDKIWLLEKFLSWQQSCPHWDLFLEDCLPPYHFI
ncbi:hypothetical protein B6N60_01435 [Richelia sinica FACHB-800]|uniref:Gas vesicle protein n=1 Tax=Richelia sinica FACHB-800 TaxID=1357546 RepID=A0A975T650_9NOST|nr:GvpL/GvpF family gas vesicle protein [Richelia sinica]MBD2663687.1 GvpL/GvpF family gas vesicle protein [Richelia sinica FACHB-800]QXE22749.1 hypothetical protein B6N60_01435 [Richelia sinica FACHB-800]